MIIKFIKKSNDHHEIVKHRIWLGSWGVDETKIFPCEVHWCQRVPGTSNLHKAIFVRRTCHYRGCWCHLRYDTMKIFQQAASEGKYFTQCCTGRNVDEPRRCIFWIKLNLFLFNAIKPKCYSHSIMFPRHRYITKYIYSTHLCWE